MNATKKSTTNTTHRVREMSTAGISFGSALSMILSWDHNHSVLYAIAHGFLSWVYVAYWVIRWRV